jgi:hypothetical protein
MAQTTSNSWKKLLSDRNRTLLDLTLDRSDRFVAFTSSAPAIDTHPSIDWKTTTIITGPIAR